MGAGCQQRHCFIDHIPQTEGDLLQRQFAGFEFGKVEYIIDDIEQILC